MYYVVLQRFRVKIEYIKPDKLDAATTIKGLDYIDVPRLATRDYKLTFHSYKECQPLIKVFFMSHLCFYNIFMVIVVVWIYEREGNH